MTFRKGKSGNTKYGGNVNIWVKNSKTLAEDDLEAMAEAEPDQFPESVRLLVVAVTEATEGTEIDITAASVLVDEVLERDEFSSGAIGYKYSIKDARFI